MKRQTLRVSVPLMIGLSSPAAGRGAVEGLKVKAGNRKDADSIIGIEQG